MSTPVQVMACAFRGDGYYALRLRDGVIDVRRCAWNDLLNGIDIYDEADEKLYATVMDPAVFDRVFWGRVTAVSAVVEGEIVR